MTKVLKNQLAIVLSASLVSCATTRPEKNFLVGAGIGAVTGAGGGALLSPNKASRGWNALIFSLSGALIGGLLGLYRTSREDPPSADQDSLALREKSVANGKIYSLPAGELKNDLPAYVKERLSNFVIEEENSRDEIREDGSLHEPHKVYRIRRTPELLTKDSTPSNETKKEATK